MTILRTHAAELLLDPAWLPTSAFVVLGTLLVVVAIWAAPAPIRPDGQRLSRLLDEGQPVGAPTPGTEGNHR